MIFRGLVAVCLYFPVFTYAALGTPSISFHTDFDDTETVISRTLTHSLVSGSDRILVCAGSYESNAGQISNATLIGTGAMTSVPVVRQGPVSSAHNEVAVFYMLEADLPAGGSVNVRYDVSGDAAGNGALNVFCGSVSGALQEAPPVFGETNSNNFISDTVGSVAVGDILWKVTSSGQGGRTHTHGGVSWTEELDLSEPAPHDSSTSIATHTVASAGSQVASTTISGSNNRLVQVVIHIQEAGTAPDLTGTTIIMTECPSQGSFAPDPHRGLNDCGASNSQNCCPPIPTNSMIPTFEDTTADFEFNTTFRSGQWAVCAATSDTANTAAQIEAGTGTCAATATGSVNSQTGKVTGSFTGLSANTTYYVQATPKMPRWFSRPVLVSSAFTTQSGAPPAGDYIKWNPGHYISGTRASSTKNINQLLARTTEAGQVDYIKGLMLRFSWNNLEGNTAGDYQSGFELVDQFLSRAASQPFPVRLIIELPIIQTFGGYNCIGNFPAYLCDGNHVSIAPEGTAYSGSLTMKAKAWTTFVRDRLVAMSAAYGARYNDHPLVEAVMLYGESALPQDIPGVNPNNYAANLEYIWEQARSHWPNTTIVMGMNFDPTNDNRIVKSAVNDFLRRGGYSGGGPDPARRLDATFNSTYQKCFRGDIAGCNDARGEAPIQTEVQSATLCSRSTSTPREIYEFFEDTFAGSPSHMLWLYNDYCGAQDYRVFPGDGVEDQRWGDPGGVKAYINSINGAVDLTTCPTSYTDNGYTCLTGATTTP